MFIEMQSIDSMFELAIELRDKGKFRDSINVLRRILQEYPADNQTSGIYLILGGVHADLGEKTQARENFQRATELNPKSELASLGLYVTHCDLNQDEEAIQELIRYLENYPANLYKETLKELLEGRRQGI
jgi:tetratricopeptide (TPR) repeat protein